MSTSSSDALSPILIIVMGVSGCGKSTTGAALAQHLASSHFLDGDDLHPKSNVEKMASGHPLTDADRAPWLALIRSTADRLTDPTIPIENTDTPGKKAKIVIIACSALKRSYRDILRGAHPAAHEPPHPSDISSDHPVPEAHEPSTKRLKTYFVFVDGPKEVLMRRMSARQGHFMKETMLNSQLETLERPDGEESRVPGGDVIVVDLQASTDDQVKQAVEGLGKLGAALDRIQS